MTAPHFVDHRSFRHWGGFIFSGSTAFVVDVGITWVLVEWIHLDPFTSRLLGIAVATVVAWLMHRRISFNVPYPPSLMEFVRFFAIASGANGATFVTYSLILLILPATPLMAAIVGSSCVGGALSYIGFRYGVFHYRFDKDQPDQLIPPV